MIWNQVVDGFPQEGRLVLLYDPASELQQRYVVAKYFVDHEQEGEHCWLIYEDPFNEHPAYYSIDEINVTHWGYLEAPQVPA